MSRPPTTCTWTRKPTPEPTRFDDLDNWDTLPQDGDSVVFPAWPERLIPTDREIVLDTVTVYGPNSRGVIGWSIDRSKPLPWTFGHPAD